MHRMLIKKGSAEEGLKDEGKLLASALEYRGGSERKKPDAYSGASGLGGPVGRRGHFILTSMEKALEYGR